MTFWEFISPISIELKEGTSVGATLIWALIMALVALAINAGYLYAMIYVARLAWQ